MMAETLKFRLADGRLAVEEAELDETELPAGEFLVAREMLLADGERKLRQHRAASERDRGKAFERLDNEILAGRRLAAAAARGGYPPELARLHGDDADGPDPYALFDPFRGHPLRSATHTMPATEQQNFPVSLLRGLCWLAAVGIAHRGIGPDTVWWDGRCAQIVDFSMCTVFGVPRTPVRGFPAWVPEEQRPGSTNGRVGPLDDIWAAAQLIFYAHTEGQEYVHPDQLADSRLDRQVAEALARAFGLLATRPTASELLAQLGAPDPSPRGYGAGALLADGRAIFLAARDLKHPGALVPADFNEDLEWAHDAASMASPPDTAAAPGLVAGEALVSTASPPDGQLPDGQLPDGQLPDGQPPDMDGGPDDRPPADWQSALGQDQARPKKNGLFGRRRDRG